MSDDEADPGDTPADGDESDSTPADGDESASPVADADVDAIDPFQLESRLTSHAIYVTALSGSVAEGFELTYQSMSAEQGGVPHRELGRVVNVFRDLLGDDATAIEATVTDLDDDAVATWHVEREWLAGLEAGTYTEIEFSNLVVDTLAPVE